jgi:hypothetical protein
MTDRQRATLAWLFVAAVLATAAWLFADAMSHAAYACHRFSVWKYPHPQPKCQVASHDWYVEFVLPPAAPEEVARARAIEALKEQLR